MEADWRWGAQCSYTSLKHCVHSLETLKGRGDDTRLFASSSSERSPISSDIQANNINPDSALLRDQKEVVLQKRPAVQGLQKSCVFEYNYNFASSNHLLLEIESHAENMKL